jgi:chemotaxis protein CheX
MTGGMPGIPGIDLFFKTLKSDEERKYIPFVKIHLVDMEGQTLDVKIINPFINATLNVLETMAFIKSEAQKPYLKKDNVAKGDISGIVGLTGETNGTVFITFDEPCIVKVVSNMFGEEITEINDDIKDAVGELTNMISGQARKELEEIGKVFQGAIPSVVSGKNHELIPVTGGPKIAVPFKTEFGNFIIEVVLDG